jgi:hypothetical protein
LEREQTNKRKSVMELTQQQPSLPRWDLLLLVFFGVPLKTW